SINRLALSKNNLTYIAAKPYPTMALIVSVPEERAKYIWVQEALNEQEILLALGDSNSARKIRIPLRAPIPFSNSRHRILEYVAGRKNTIDQWIATAAHTHLLVNLYLDIHAALDALIECIELVHSQDRTDDETSFKQTYSFILTVTAYGILYGNTSTKHLPIYGPLSSTMLGLRNQFRTALSEMLSEKTLQEYESGRPEGQEGNDLFIFPAKISPFFPAVPKLAVVVRDVLRTMATFLSPTRDFSSQMSGLANMVIEYEKRDTTQPTDNQNGEKAG
ncbi:MAG: hypothetical protein MJA83_06415, partial [Gammaproteobacteria bacterium]|nr:hypothetical protein [Gammaproteobacteria bacterium]